MPLQKPLPRGMAPTDQLPSNSRQIQGRRRSLHTISELCVTDDAAPDFSSFIAGKPKQRSHPHRPATKRSSQDLSKRRSLPQYSSSQQCLQPLAVSPPMHPSSPHHVQTSQDPSGNEIAMEKEGWNTRREKARIQSERAVAASTYRQQPLSRIAPTGDYSTISRKPIPSLSSANIRSYSSQQMLANSRSISGISSSSSNNKLDHRSSLGTMAGHSDASTFDIGSPERESTDSSSYQSTRDSAVRRSRSGSSSDASCASPALPIALPPPKPRHHSMPTRYIHKKLAAAPSYVLPSQPGTGTRTSSLPTLHVGHVESPGQNKRHSTSSQHHQHSDIQRARLESLAALTAERPLSFAHRHNTYPHPMRSPHRPSVSSRPRPHSYHKSPPQPLSTPPPPNTRYYPKSTSPNTLEKRIVPKRETLTQWKAERDEAKMEFYGIRRASMKERVRRANELEQEREEELVRMGKGTGEKGECDDDGVEGGAGCFGGILGMFRMGR